MRAHASGAAVPPGGGDSRARPTSSGGAGPGGASAGVPGTRDTGAAEGTGGVGATGGIGGAGLGGASAGGPGVGRAEGTGIGSGADIGGTPGGTTGSTGVSGASRQESLSPLQLCEWAVRWGSPSGGAGGTRFGGAVATGAGGSGGATTRPQPSALRHLLSLPPAAIEFLLLPGSLLLAPAPHTKVIASLTAHCEPETRASTPEQQEPATRAPVPARVRRVRRPRAPTVSGTHDMTLRPPSVPQRVVLPSPPASSLPHIPDPESDLLRAASPTITHLLATVVTDPSFESAATSALVAELVDFAALCLLDYAASLVFDSSCPPSVGGELALCCDVLEDMQFELECLAAATPHLMSMLLCPEGDTDAADIPTPRTYAEAITGPYSSQWQIAMDAEMTSWKSKGTYVDKVPPPGANIVDGMWIFRVKRPPGSPHAFKARYVARGFRQHDLHEATWLRRPRGFTGSFPEGTQWSLRRPVYGLRQAPREWHDTLRTTLAAPDFVPSTADPLLFLCTDTSLPPFYVLVYVDDLVFATADTEALALVKAEVQERHTCTTMGELRSYLGLHITRDRAWRTITLTQLHMVQHVLQRFDFTWSSPQPTPLSTGHSLSDPPSDESVEPSSPHPELVGYLMYLMMCTRPDLAYPLSLLARYVAPDRH
ncbi:unnamed protein product [Closterium sp. NIES-54]